MFEFLHGINCIRINGFDVGPLCHTHVRMPQDGLVHLVLHSQAVKISRQSTAKGMPNDIADESIKRVDAYVSKSVRTAVASWTREKGFAINPPRRNGTPCLWTRSAP